MQRRDRNSLFRLKEANGVWLEGHAEVIGATVNYFSDIYAPTDPTIASECIAVVPKLITEDMNSKLIAPISSMEVKNAVFDLGALKAPGPDGLNGDFYQKNWATISSDVIATIEEFFSSGSIGNCINDTLVALIPKVQHPESISQLRPISCCNFIYKIISKIIVKRIKPLLTNLISPQQSAFVGGRLIQDNLVVAQEAFHFLKKNSRAKSNGFAIKLDMNKAYDRVDWSFLRVILLAYGFCLPWVNLIMSLVSPVRYQFQVNGHRSKTVTPSRGLLA